jgi:hypothetical protein
MPRRLLALLIACALFSTTAFAATPRPVGAATVRNPRFHGDANTMMYTVAVKVDGTAADADHVAAVGYVEAADYTTCTDATTPWKWASSQTYDTSATRTWTLYNFVPGRHYYYKWMVGDPSGTVRTRCGPLQTTAAPTPTLPDNLADLNIQYQKSGAAYESRYVLVETNDCGTGTPGDAANYYLVVVDADEETIVWYLDVGASTGIRGVGNGLKYEEGLTPDDDRIHLSVSNEAIFEWGFDGSTKQNYDFTSVGGCDGSVGSMGPCLLHDVARSNETGNTYAVAAAVSSVDPTGTEWDLRCDTSSRFLDEGYVVLDSDGAVTGDNFIIADAGFDPAVDGGPDASTYAKSPGSCASHHWAGVFDPAYGMIDWGHENSLAVSSFGGDEVIDLSFKQWDEIVRFDALTGDLLWTLSPNAGYSDWGPVQMAAGVAGPADFDSQHDVHPISSSRLMMLDNRGSPVGSRVLEVELRAKPLVTVIQKSWALVDAAGDPLRCPKQGTAQPVPGSTDDHVLSTCADEWSIMELDDPTGGTGSPPPLYISLPDGTSEPFCASGGPASRRDIQGWHRGYPLERVGEF